MSDDLAERMRRLETQMSDVRVDTASTKEAVTNLQKDVDAVKAGFTWFFRVTGATAIAAFLAWVFQGGMGNVGK